MGVVCSYLTKNLNQSSPVYNPVMVALTPEQVAIIQETWKIPAKNATDSGEAILLRYFEKYPHNQDKFQAFKNTPLLTLKGAPGFRTHASRIMAVFDESVNILHQENALEEIKRIWTVVGHNHAKRKISKKSFEELRSVILEVLTAACQLDSTQQQAWAVVMDNVYSVVWEYIP